MLQIYMSICINQTNPLVRKGFGLDRLLCNGTNYNKEKRGCTQCHAKDTPTRFKFEQDNQTKVEIQPSTHQVKAVYQI